MSVCAIVWGFRLVAVPLPSHSLFKKRMGGFFMATINLRDFYPFYHEDAWIEISDELAGEIKSWERKENNYKRKCRYHGNYSLDREDT